MSLRAEPFDYPTNDRASELLTREQSLRADHDELAALIRSVSAEVVRGEKAGVARAISLLQTRVLAHLAGEERDLFERYAVYAPQDAGQLRFEHAAIRRQLSDLDVAVDLHTLRADALNAFLATLRTHAKHEDDGLYRWSTEVAR